MADATLMTQTAAEPSNPQPAGGSSSAAAPATTAAAAPAAGATAAQQQAAPAGTEPKPGDTEPVDGKPAATTEPKPAEPAAAKAPEKYEFKAPVEGETLDAGIAASFSEVAKDLNLPQEAAQKVIDKMLPVLAQRQVDAIAKARTEWETAATSDKEFGGEALPQNLGVAKKAMDAFGTPELRTLLNESGLGNHPEVIRFMFRAGKAMSEDGMVTGTKSAPTKTTAQRMYPNMNP